MPAPHPPEFRRRAMDLARQPGEAHWVSFRLISQDGNDGQVYERDA